jgi:NAD+ synthase (glutamine-hydrolysing)
LFSPVFLKFSFSQQPTAFVRITQMIPNAATLKLAIAQLNPTIGDLAGNSQCILSAAEQALTAGAEILLTPELSLCGYPPRDLLLSEGFLAAVTDQLTQLAQALPPQLTVLVGTVTSLTEAAPTAKRLRNSVALLQGGQVQQFFHKRLLPTYDVFDEDRYFTPGEHPGIFSFTTASGKTLQLGVTICEDLWNDELFWEYRAYPVDPVAEVVEAGAELILNLSASPFSIGKQQLRERILAHAAQRHLRSILYVNQVGGNDDLIFDGRSVGFNPQGQLVARAKAFQTDLTVWDYDLNTHQLQTGTITPQPEGRAAETWAALVLGVADYSRKCGFSKAVIGLSGGIDSALVAAIAVAALGPEQVLGVLMPSPYSSTHSISDAEALAACLGIKTTIVPIAPLMQSFEHSLDALFTGTSPGIAEENIQARIRGNLLMAIANKFGYLLISTGNKSEIAVGYCTLYGDMSGGLAAIADVPKTQVYAICEWLNQAVQTPGLLPFQSPMVIPVNILQKPPSAELKPDQFDQDSLPAYDVLDDILERLINQHQSAATIIATGHEPATVARVLQLVHRAEFKRRQAAPGLKITERAFGSGWRMPIAAKSVF